MRVGHRAFDLLLSSAEANIVQSCCGLLEQFFAAAGAAVLSWATTSPQEVICLLNRCFKHLLKPQGDEARAATMEGFAIQVVLAAREAWPQVPRWLLQMCAARAPSCSTAVLRGQLLVIVARCVACLVRLPGGWCWCWHVGCTRGPWRCIDRMVQRTGTNKTFHTSGC